MNTHLLNSDKLIMTWKELETAWATLADPEYRHLLPGLLTMVRTLAKTAEPQALTTLVMALTSCLLEAAPQEPGEYLSMEWRDLESAWNTLSHPAKFPEVTDTVDSVRAMALKFGAEHSALTVVSATAWLTSEGGNDLKPG
nr:hypothetical protein [Asticcacaulis sp. AND118]